tara:strand:+ start:245 stop:721 length:477 start_codon:yes stop_codon:yes gene_type:complete
LNYGNQLYKNSTKHKGGGIMSMCKVCHKDSEKHSEKTWLLHQQKLKCAFCGESSLDHSEKLWEIHHEAVPKNAKLATILLGRGPKVLAKIEKRNTVKVNGRDSPYHLEYVPIYMLCSECGTTLGNAEEKLADVFDRTCLECFCNMTEQEYKWYESPRI